MAINRDILWKKINDVLSNWKIITENKDNKIFPNGRFLIS